MQKTNTMALMWFRRDLRLTDNATLYQALRRHQRVVAVFIFDTHILSRLPRNDRRISFIYNSLLTLKQDIEALGGELMVHYADPVDFIPLLAHQLGVAAVYAGEDYEPYARERDAHIAASLTQQGQSLHLIKDQVIFAKDDVLSQKGTPLTVFTPYKNAWLKRLTVDDLITYPTSAVAPSWHTSLEQPTAMPTLDTLGFDLQPLLVTAGETGAQQAWQDFESRIDHYNDQRDFPAVKGVSYLSVHLRFGTISIRQLVLSAWMHASEGSQTWLSELIWREFYMQFLYHHPEVAHQAYKKEWRNQPWGNRHDWFQAWCTGQTGYPIVDAAMHQLNQTGFMHNRLRMIVAAFLVKDLDINWQWGEAYFAQQLLDFDLSANNGGWQWAASTGCDAAQPFRIFNPILQSKKFDGEGRFIRKYLPVLNKFDDKTIHAPWLLAPLFSQNTGVLLGKDYPFPLVDHEVARKKALDKYAMIRRNNENCSN